MSKKDEFEAGVNLKQNKTDANNLLAAILADGTGNANNIKDVNKELKNTVKIATHFKDVLSDVNEEQKKLIEGSISHFNDKNVGASLYNAYADEETMLKNLTKAYDEFSKGVKNKSVRDSLVSTHQLLKAIGVDAKKMPKGIGKTVEGIIKDVDKASGNYTSNSYSNSHSLENAKLLIEEVKKWEQAGVDMSNATKAYRDSAKAIKDATKELANQKMDKFKDDATKNIGVIEQKIEELRSSIDSTLEKLDKASGSMNLLGESGMNEMNKQISQYKWLVKQWEKIINGKSYPGGDKYNGLRLSDYKDDNVKVPKGLSLKQVEEQLGGTVVDFKNGELHLEILTNIDVKQIETVEHVAEEIVKDQDLIKAKNNDVIYQLRQEQKIAEKIRDDYKRASKAFGSLLEAREKGLKGGSAGNEYNPHNLAQAYVNDALFDPEATDGVVEEYLDKAAVLFADYYYHQLQNNLEVKDVTDRNTGEKMNKKLLARANKLRAIGGNVDSQNIITPGAYLKAASFRNSIYDIDYSKVIEQENKVKEIEKKISDLKKSKKETPAITQKEVKQTEDNAKKEEKAVEEVAKQLSTTKKETEVERRNNLPLEERISLLRDMKKAASDFHRESQKDDGGAWLDRVQSKTEINGNLYDSLEECYALYKVIVTYANGTKGVFDEIYNPDVNPDYDMFRANDQFRTEIDLRRKIVDVRFEEVTAEEVEAKERAKYTNIINQATASEERLTQAEIEALKAPKRNAPAEQNREIAESAKQATTSVQNLTNALKFNKEQFNKDVETAIPNMDDVAYYTPKDDGKGGNYNSAKGILTKIAGLISSKQIDLSTKKDSMSQEEVNSLVDEIYDLATQLVATYNIIDDYWNGKLGGKSGDASKPVKTLMDAITQGRFFDNLNNNYIKVDQQQSPAPAIEQTAQALEHQAEAQQDVDEHINQNGTLLDIENQTRNNTSVLKEEIDSVKELLSLLFQVKTYKSSIYEGKYNSEWIGLYNSQEEAISSDITDKTSELNNSFASIIAKDNSAIQKLQVHASKLSESLNSVQELSSRISKNSSVIDLYKGNIGSEEFYKNIAQAYADINTRLGELINSYHMTDAELEEFITLQMKASKIIDEEANRYGGVQGSGAKNKNELNTWIERGFARDLGIDENKIYNGLFGNIADAKYGINGLPSLYDENGRKRTLREISSSILGLDSYSTDSNASELKDANTILKYYKENKDLIQNADFSDQIEKSQRRIIKLNKILEDKPNDTFWQNKLEEETQKLRELLILQQEIIESRKVLTQKGAISTSNTVIEQNDQETQAATEAAVAEEKLAQARSDANEQVNQSEISSATSTLSKVEQVKQTLLELEQSTKHSLVGIIGKWDSLDEETKKVATNILSRIGVMNQNGEFTFTRASGSNSKAIVLDDLVILQKNLDTDQAKLENTITTLDELKQKGVNVARVLGTMYSTIDQKDDKFFKENNMNYHSGYEIQEKAIGSEFHKNPRTTSAEETIAEDDKLLQLSYQQLQKFIEDWIVLRNEFKFNVDPSKATNFFVDLQNGIQFIDLGAEQAIKEAQSMQLILDEMITIFGNMDSAKKLATVFQNMGLLSEEETSSVLNKNSKYIRPSKQNETNNSSQVPVIEQTAEAVHEESTSHEDNTTKIEAETEAVNENTEAKKRNANYSNKSQNGFKFSNLNGSNYYDLKLKYKDYSDETELFSDIQSSEELRIVEYSEQALKNAEKICESLGASKENAAAIAGYVQEFMDGNNFVAQNIFRILSKDAGIAQDTIKGTIPSYRQMMDYLKGNKIRIDSQMRSEFGGTKDWFDVRNTIGASKFTTNQTSGKTIDELLTELNETFGDNLFPIMKESSASSADLIRALYDWIVSAKSQENSNDSQRLDYLRSNVGTEGLTSIIQTKNIPNSISSLKDLNAVLDLFRDKSGKLSIELEDLDAIFGSLTKDTELVNSLLRILSKELGDMPDSFWSSALKIGGDALARIKSENEALQKVFETAKGNSSITLNQSGKIGDEETGYSYTKQTGQNQTQRVNWKYNVDENGDGQWNVYYGRVETKFKALQKQIQNATDVWLKREARVEELELKQTKDGIDRSKVITSQKTSVSNAESIKNTLLGALEGYATDPEMEYSEKQHADFLEEEVKRIADIRNGYKVAREEKEALLDDKNIKAANKSSKIIARNTNAAQAYVTTSKNTVSNYADSVKNNVAKPLINQSDLDNIDRIVSDTESKINAIFKDRSNFDQDGKLLDTAKADMKQYIAKAKSGIKEIQDKAFIAIDMTGKSVEENISKANELLSNLETRIAKSSADASSIKDKINKDGGLRDRVNSAVDNKELKKIVGDIRKTTNEFRELDDKKKKEEFLSGTYDKQTSALEQRIKLEKQLLELERSNKSEAEKESTGFALKKGINIQNGVISTQESKRSSEDYKDDTKEADYKKYEGLKNATLIDEIKQKAQAAAEEINKMTNPPAGAVEIFDKLIEDADTLIAKSKQEGVSFKEINDLNNRYISDSEHANSIKSQVEQISDLKSKLEETAKASADIKIESKDVENELEKINKELDTALQKAEQGVLTGEELKDVVNNYEDGVKRINNINTINSDIVKACDEYDKLKQKENDLLTIQQKLISSGKAHSEVDEKIEDNAVDIKNKYQEILSIKEKIDKDPSRSYGYDKVTTAGYIEGRIKSAGSSNEKKFSDAVTNAETKKAAEDAANAKKADAEATKAENEAVKQLEQSLKEAYNANKAFIDLLNKGGTDKEFYELFSDVDEAKVKLEEVSKLFKSSFGEDKLNNVLNAFRGKNKNINIGDSLTSLMNSFKKYNGLVDVSSMINEIEKIFDSLDLMDFGGKISDPLNSVIKNIFNLRNAFNSLKGTDAVFNPIQKAINKLKKETVTRNKVTQFASEVKEYESQFDILKSSWTGSDEDLESLNNIFKELTNLWDKRNDYKTTTSKGTLIDGLVGKVSNIDAAKAALDEFYAGYEKLTIKQNPVNKNMFNVSYLDDATGKMKSFAVSFDEVTKSMRYQEQEYSRLGAFGDAYVKSWGNVIKSMVGFMGGYRLIMRLTSAFREGVETLKDYDEALTKISYTMDLLPSELENLGQAARDMAEDLSISLENATEIYQIYANMKTTTSEIETLGTPTAILANLSGMDASTTADYIQAVLNQFDEEADQAMHIADVYDYISSQVAVDYSKGIEGIAEAVEAVGNVAYQSGLSFEQLSAIIATTMEQTRQEGSQIGNALKTIMVRLSKASTMSDEVDNSTLSKASAALHAVGVEVYTTSGEFREFDTIMSELAAKWDDLTEAQQANISYQVAA